MLAVESAGYFFLRSARVDRAVRGALLSMAVRVRFARTLMICRRGARAVRSPAATFPPLLLPFEPGHQA